MTNNAINSNIPIEVTKGGTQSSSFVAYAPIVGGTTSTGALQSVASAGNAGDVLVSGGNSALPSFQGVTCAFLYTLDIDANNVTGNGTDYAIGSTVPLTKKYDIGNNMTTSGVFTAPSAGIYYLYLCFEFINVTTATSGFGLIIPSGQVPFIFAKAPNISQNEGGVSYGVVAIVQLAANDTVTFQCRANGQGADTVGLNGDSGYYETYITGYKIK